MSTMVRRDGTAMREWLMHEVDMAIEQVLEHAVDDLRQRLRARFHGEIETMRADHMQCFVVSVQARYREMEVERTNMALDATARLALGECPHCNRFIKGWKPPFGSFAPEAWASLREAGVDPVTGHLLSCTHKDLRVK